LSNASGGGGEARISRAAWLTLAILVILASVSYIDRQIISLMVQPIRRDLGISDFQISLLQGIAFALFFAAFGLPLGWLVDRTQRRLVIWGGVTVWSLATAASGLASSFGHLFLARLMVGAGEAALAPAAYSLIADLFPKRRLAVALAAYATGGSLGSALAVFLGGVLIERLSHVSLAFGGAPLATWQLAFLSVGVPGLAFSLLIFLAPEPPRTARGSTPDGGGMAELLAFLRSRRSFLLCHFFGFACMSALGYAVMNWLPAYVMRHYGVPVGQAGAWVGAMIVCSIPGALLTGAFVDRLFARGRTDAHLLVYLVLALLLAILGACAFFVRALPVVAAMMGLLMFLAAAPGTASAALQIVTPGRLRGRVSALFLFVYQMVGLGTGPMLVALFTDYVFKDDAKVGFAMGSAVVIFGIASASLLALGRGPMRRAVADLAAEEASAAA
jgi:MFS family permease